MPAIAGSLFLGVDLGVLSASIVCGEFALRGDVGTSEDALIAEMDGTRERGVSGASKVAERGVPGVGGRGGISSCDVGVGVRANDLEDQRLSIPGLPELVGVAVGSD